MLQTPEHIQLFQLCALRTGLVLEMKGLTKSGRSCYAILKGMGYKGNRNTVLEAVKADIAAQFKEFGIV